MKEAMVKGTYSDYRRVKGRKVLQMIIEVPLEQAPQVHEAFGEPLTDGSMWVAVAKLNETKENEPTTKQTNPHRLSQQAAMLCDDTLFQNFLSKEIAAPDDALPLDSTWAAYIGSGS